ncbi:transposase [Levilactobacillus senmaizukei]|uniref:transposase n=1 Tax=Levilactobacillus senmaizukei TaxID=431273 RepID=UPI001F1C0004|nr:transposase [Levilactobacillus senmaizukei]
MCTVKFRVCKFRINNEESGKDEWEVLVTNLNSKEFSLEEMKELYHLRWGIESSFRKLKYDISSVQFHSKQDHFIEMELWAHLIIFNVVSHINAEVAIPQNNCNYSYLVNFKMSCVVVHKRYGLSPKTNYDRILIEIGHYLLPIRPDRKDRRKISSKTPVYFTYRVA